jgi:hypothetical protein
MLNKRNVIEGTEMKLYGMKKAFQNGKAFFYIKRN